MCKNSEGVEERMSIFMIDKDLGNVAYSSWIKSVLDQGTMYELLGQWYWENQEGVRAVNSATPRRERPTRRARTESGTDLPHSSACPRRRYLTS